MKTYYISPSTIPSRSANSIHVVNMCEALTQLNHDVTLFVRSETLDSEGCKAAIKDFYGIDSTRIDVVVYQCRMARGAELIIALRALLCFVIDFFSGDAPDFIISRNLYGAVLLGLLFRRKVVYETHAPDKGIRKVMQGWLVRSLRTPSIVISAALRKVLALLHGVPEEMLYVMPDAARAGQGPMSDADRQCQQEILLGASLDVSAYDMIVGYFGQLFPGRGIEIIQGVAAAIPHYAFIVYGGNEKEIKSWRENNTNKNLYFMGHLPPGKVRKAMAMMDVLLMPYQKTVSIGLNGVDTAQWMSPMKLFEYMSVGVPIISSDLPVLREVLTDRFNCLLVVPDDVMIWTEALGQLASSPELASSISGEAYEQFREEYNWGSRAQKIICLVGGE